MEQAQKMSSADKTALAELYMDSDMKAKDFAEQHGISESALGYYVTKVNKARKAAQATPKAQNELTVPKESNPTAFKFKELERIYEERIHELEMQLAEANKKIRSLQNIMFVIGNQFED